MAHRIISQVVIVGARVVGRAFAEAYRQAAASQKYTAAIANDPKKFNTLTASGLSMDEACKILDVAPVPSGPAAAETNLEPVLERFKRLFDQNDPKKGGSFYLQSKILRARERIELEVRTAQRQADVEQEAKEGWKPKVYKDR